MKAILGATKIKFYTGYESESDYLKEFLNERNVNYHIDCDGYIVYENIHAIFLLEVLMTVSDKLTVTITSSEY